MPDPRRLGTYETTSVAGESVRAFVPPPLPPDPPLAISPALQDLIEKTNRGLGRLDGVVRILPDPSLFLYTYVRKEALLSSQIEGAQSSFSDLLLFEAEPPPHRVMEWMGQLEKFLHDDPVKTPLLIKAALTHVQFETIHPFLDGNGRVGRLLITLLLCAEEALSEPMLYLSLYFKANRDAYYELLQRVRTEGDWESWLDFFLRGVIETTEQATSTAKKIMELFTADRARIEALGRPAASALRVYTLLQRRVVMSIPKAAKQLGISQPTVTSAIENLAGLGIAREITGRKRRKLYMYDTYAKILDEGAEPIR